MKIISLNTWNGKCREDLEVFIREQKETTDIFLFQEASVEMDKIRRQELKGWPSLSLQKLEVAYDDELFQMIVFRKGIRLVTAGTFFVEDDEQGLGLWAEMRMGDQSYIVCNIHGIATPVDKQDCDSRRRQSQEILDFLKGKTGKHIIMGDFNLFPETESIQTFEAHGYKNLIKDYAIETTRNELAWSLYPGNKQLWADYAFVGPGVEVTDFQVPQNEISDHLPMILEIA